MSRRYWGIVLVTLMGCEPSDSNIDVSARLGWQFDYQDWSVPTATEATADLRHCDNQPAVAQGPAYDAIAKVRVQIEDPAGQVPGVDHVFDCKDGSDGKRIDVHSLIKQSYRLTLEALNSQDDVLYRYDEPNFDLSSRVEQTFTLRAATGELHFFPRFGSSSTLACPPNVSDFEYSVVAQQTFATRDDAMPQVSGRQAACSDSYSNELYIRNIPIQPVLTANNAYSPNDFYLVVKALDSSGNVSHCGRAERVVRPGNNSLAGDETLMPGDC